MSQRSLSQHLKMHTKLLLVFAFASVISGHDISIGSDTEGRKIFDEIRQANPAIWRQIENVTIIAPDDEVISRVVVTDMRPEKDGDVQIVDGGDGMKSVTIELKSPTVLRGYEFHLEVYTVPETKLTDAEEHLYEKSSADNNDASDTSESSSQEKDGSGDEAELEMPGDAEKTTELPESSTIQDGPVLVGKVVDGDILRPARETSDENSPQILPSIENINLNPLIIGSESDLSTESVSTDSVEVTTDADMTTISNDSEEITIAPVSFDNSKNIPDYPALSILDYIKSKEGSRQIRRTDDETNESNNDATTTEKLVEMTDNVDKLDVDTSYMLPTDEPSLKPQNNNDDTLDLVPPEETDYNTGFSLNNENTEKPVEISTDIYNGPRAGRGLVLDDSQEETTSTTMSATDLTTPGIDTENSTTEGTLDEQSRNPRETDLEDNSNGLDASIDSNQNEQITLCRAQPSENDTPSNNPTPNIILVNGEQLTLSPDSNHKLQFGIPIILIIGSETNIPTIKIIAGVTNDDKNINVFPSAENSMDNSGPVLVPEDKLNESQDNPAENNMDVSGFVPVPEDKLNDSQDKEFSDEFIPKPIKSLK